MGSRKMKGARCGSMVGRSDDGHAFTQAKLFDFVGYLISVAGRTLLDIRLRARRYRLGVETRMLRTLRGEASEEVRIADCRRGKSGLTV